MDQGLIPRRYAKALYEVGYERNDIDALYAAMGRLANAFADTPGLAGTVANPFVAKGDKARLLTTAAYGADSPDIDPVFNDFIKLLERNERLDLARDIALAFISLYREKHSIYRVDIVSAAKLADNERSRLESIIENHIGKGKFEYDYRVDPSLIGGFTVTVNSERLDASVRTQLKNLRLKLID